LPTCSPKSDLNASKLGVTPGSGNVNGYTSNTNIGADPQFATYLSTPARSSGQNATVLLSGSAAMGTARYVLGPAALTEQDVASASVQQTFGQWTLVLVLTNQGSAKWDALTQQQFHSIIGVVLNGKVISAPITQPTQSSWTSFNGQIQISGSFSRRQAKAIAAELQIGK
jgi:preprotein translocase subunit SecD